MATATCIDLWCHPIPIVDDQFDTSRFGAKLVDGSSDDMFLSVTLWTQEKKFRFSL